MRKLFLDTETTGLETSHGHRIIEIGVVEVINRRQTGNTYHRLLNPEREIDARATEIHGRTLESLKDEPRFADIAREFLDFIAGAELIIHNAPFDVGFLNCELGLIGMEGIESICSTVTDTLKMAKELRPGQRNNLDALCKHYGVDNSVRTLHGALLDAELLADVYLAMTRGQETLMMDIGMPSTRRETGLPVGERLPLKVISADTEELEAHAAYVVDLDKSCNGDSLWRQLEVKTVDDAA